MVLEKNGGSKLLKQNNDLRPVLSIIASAVRTSYWLNFYESISNNIDYPFEIVFVGDKRPDYELPDNFRYIYSEVKPTQCIEIAARNARGKYICDSADDLEFSTNFYNILIRRMDDMPMNVALVPMISRNGKVKKGALRIKKHDMKSPIVGMITFIRRKMWYKLGGLDRNFISVWHNHDLKLRLIEGGGKCVPINSAVANENDTQSEILLRNVSGNEDQSFLYSCWYKGPTFSKKRLKTFEPYIDTDLLTVSQGNSGKWK